MCAGSAGPSCDQPTRVTRPRLKERYVTELRPALQQELGLGNVMQVPRLEKIVLNCGVGQATQQQSLLDGAVADLGVITGQKPLVTRARKSIAGFKLREGNAIGAKVTLRGDRMWEFYDRLVSVAIPRIRDFRGMNPMSFDGRGNYTFGVTEQLIFPEIDYDKIDSVRGMDITHRHHRRPPTTRAEPCSAPSVSPSAATRHSRDGGAGPHGGGRDHHAATRASGGERRGARQRANDREPGIPARRERVNDMAKKALVQKQQRKPKFKVRGYTRCRRCGRARSVYRRFGLCRICLREMVHAGEVPGVTKASW